MGCNKGIQLLDDRLCGLQSDLEFYDGERSEQVITSMFINEFRSMLNDAALTQAEDYEEASDLMTSFLEDVLEGDFPVKDSFVNAVVSGQFVNIVYNPAISDIPYDYFDITTDRIFKDEDVEQSSIDSNFLQKYFGVNTGARLYAEQVWKEAFVNNILVDRHNGHLVTANDIDRNMRNYQAYLFDIVRLYIMSKVTDPEEKEKLRNLKMFTSHKALNKNDYNYLFNKAKEHLGDLASFVDNGDGTYREKITHSLSSLYDESRTSSSGKMAAKQRLDAYLAWVMLDPVNLDVYLKQQLGKAIEINDFGEFQKSTTGYKKYRLSSKATNTVTTWRSNEEIFVEEEIDNVIKLLVDTSRIYHYGQMEPSSDYMNFGQFQGVVTALKNLANQEVGNINLGTIAKSGLSEETLRAIQLPSSDGFGKEYVTFGTLINMIRRNPQKYLTAIFEILSNKNAYDTLNSNSSDGLESLKIHKDIIYSIYKNVFDPEAPDQSYTPNAVYSLNSICKINDPNQTFLSIEHNTFAQLTQVCDTIFGVHIVGYNQDNNTLSYKLLNLDANQVQRNIFSLQSGLRSKLNIYRIADYDAEVKAKYDIKVDPKTNWFTCTIGGNTLTITNTGSIDRVSKQIKPDAYSDQETLKALDEILGLNLQHNTELYNAILQEYNNDANAAVTELLTIAAHGLQVQEVNHQILDRNAITKATVDEAIKQAEQVVGKSDQLENIKSIKNAYDRIKALKSFLDDEFASNLDNQTYVKSIDDVLNFINKALSSKSTFNIQNAQIIAKTLLGSKAHVNQTLEQVDPINDADFQIYKKLAEAKAISQGITSSGQFRDSENNALSKYTPSRLLGSFRSQWELQNKSKKSTTRGLSMIQDNQLVIDVFKCREAKGQSNSKQETKMTVNELFHSGFLLDFIGGFVDADLRKEVIGSDARSTRVAFYPSVNSDKGEIDKLVIDLARPSHIEGPDGKPIAWKNLTISQLEEAINGELGEVYDNQYNAVYDDYEAIEQFIHDENSNAPYKEFFGEDFQFNPDNDFQDFNVICEKIGKPSLTVLLDLVDSYNLSHPDNFILLTDEVHYQKSDKKIVFNKSFLQAYYRTNDIVDNRFDDSKTFWQKKRNELLKSLIDSNFELLLDADSQDPKVQYLLKQKNWVDEKTGKLILAKIVMDDGHIITIKNATDYKQYIDVDNPHKIPGQVILNPELDRWNMMDYFFSQSFIMTTVGTHFTHPGKMKATINSKILNEPQAHWFKRSRFIFAAPTTGKTYFTERSGGNIKDWDDLFNDERNAMIFEDYKRVHNMPATLTWQEFKDNGLHEQLPFIEHKVNYLTNWQSNPLYQQWILDKIQEAKQMLADDPNLLIVFSPIPVLAAFKNDPSLYRDASIFAVDVDIDDMKERHAYRMHDEKVFNAYKTLHPEIKQSWEDFSKTRVNNADYLAFEQAFENNNGLFNRDYYIQEAIEWKTALDSIIVNPNNNFYIKLGKGQHLSDIFNYTQDPEIFLWEDAARFNAQHKRNVSMSASMQEFQLGLLDGIQSRYRIAILPDVKDTVFSVEGKVEDGVKPYDGATYCNPFTVYHENHSLGSARAGVHKKQFIHFYNERFTNGGIIKTAGFGLTNEWIREGGHRMLTMMKQMTDLPWMYNGAEYQVDITQNYYGYGVKLDDLYIKGPNNEVYMIHSIDQVEDDGGNPVNGQYNVIVKRCNPNGQVIEDSECYMICNTNEHGETVHDFVSVNSVTQPPVIQVHSNYDLWNLYGGLDSVEFKSGKFIPSEASIKAVVDTQNQTGVVSQEILDAAQNLSGKDRAAYIAEAVKTQDDIVQVMKYSDIQYAVTEGAIKQGAANRNDSAVYDDANQKYRYMYINMYQAGIQLDKEHHANDSEISIMTQVISACASMGYTQEQANRMYHAMSQLTELAVHDSIEAFEEFFAGGALDGNREAITQVVTKTIVDAIMSGKNNGSILDSIATELLDKAHNNKDITDEDIAKVKLPVSAQSVYPKVISTLSSMFTRSGIKLKFAGTLAVLCPSFNIMKIYGDKMYSAIGSRTKLEELQAKYNDKLLRAQDVRIGRKYRVVSAVDEKIVEIKNPTDYKNFKRKYGNGNYDITEYVMDGRELAGYNATFKATNAQGETQEFSIYDLDSVQNLADKDEKINNGLLTKDEAKRLRVLLQRDLESCSKNGPDNPVLIDGQEWTIDKNSINVEPYEIIMPKVFADNFGLQYGDDVSDILNNPFFFVERAIENMATKLQNPQNYDVELKMMNGEHVYLLDKSNITKTIDLEQVKTNIRVIDGKTYHCDGQDNPLFEMRRQDRLYIERDFAGNPHYVIVTDNAQPYVDNFEYFAVTLSHNITEDVFGKFTKNFQASDNQVAEKFMKFVQNANGDFKHIKKSNQFKADNINMLLNNLRAIKQQVDAQELKGASMTDIINHLYNSKNDILNLFRGTYKQLIMQGLQLHESFKKSLNIIAARVPSQSMQSFMPMKIVGFVKSDVNNAFVSTYQIWLQGSDYDIDAVTLLMYEFNKTGQFSGWSPYFNTKSDEFFKISSQINYPTGKELLIVDPSKSLQEKGSQKSNEDYNKVREIFAGFSYNDGKVTVNYDDPDAFNDFVTFLNNVSENGTMIDLTKVDSETLNDIVKDAFTDQDLDAEAVASIQEQIVKIVNNHNNYIRKNPRNTERFTKNFIVNQIYDIIADPINLLQAQTPVDESTKQPKKYANDKNEVAVMKSKQSGPGNVGNKYEALVTNLTGKDGIGICAVALKTFFAFTQSYNNTLSNGDKEEVKQVFFDRAFNTVVKPDGGLKHFKMLANLKTKRDLQGITNQDVIAALAEARDDADAVIVLSALLSLATDNAKELCLEKLNADTNLIGMYVYGLSIGMDFKDVAKIMMSPMASTVRTMLQGNIFLDDNGAFQVVKAVDSLVNGPKSLFSKYSMPLINENGDVIQRDAVEIAMKYFPKIALTYPNKVDKKGKPIPVMYVGADVDSQLGRVVEKYDPDLLVNIAWDPNNTLDTKLALLNQWAEQYTKGISRDSKDNIIQAYTVNSKSIRIQRFIEDIKKYFMQVDSILQSAKLLKVNPRQMVQDFMTLSLGAEEFKVAGAMFGVNQGVKTDQNSILSYVRRFENFIQDRIKNHQLVNQYTLKRTKNAVFPVRKARFFPWEEAALNDKLTKWKTAHPTADEAYARNTRDLYIRLLLSLDEMSSVTPEAIDFYQFVLDPGYRKAMVDKYEQIKHSVNALRIFDNVDHYMGYLRCVFATHASMYATSAKFRAIIDLSQGLANELNITSSKMLEKLFKNVEQFINYRMQSQYLFTHENSAKITLPAGSKYYDTSLKLRVSKVPIPINLGTEHGAATFKMFMDEVVFLALQNGDLGKGKINTSIINNSFVMSLIRSSYDRNPSHGVSESYHCDVNMLPKNNSEIIQYEGVKKDFDQLRGIDYNFEDSSVGLLELIYFYNIIAYGDKVGETTFTKLFDDMQTVGYIKEYNDLIYAIDQGELEDVIFDFDPDELKLWCILQDSKYSSVMEYIYSRNKNSQLGIYQKNRNQGEVMDDGTAVSNDRYILSPIKVINPNYNHFMHNLTSSEEEKVYTLAQSGDDKITYERIIDTNTSTPYYSGNIRPAKKTIFVFGSNPEGRHGAGAAKTAVEKFGAIYGQGEGLQGNAYALPTKDLRVTENDALRSISKEDIIANIKKMYDVARQNPDKTFKVAYRNTTDTSLNGYTGLEMIEMFKAAGPIPENVMFSKEWVSTGAFDGKKSNTEYGVKLSFTTPGLAEKMAERIKVMAEEQLKVIAEREGKTVKKIQKRYRNAGYSDVEIALGVMKGRGTTIQFNPMVLKMLQNELDSNQNPC